MPRFALRFPSIVLALLAVPCFAQLRIATWNISNYNGGRDADLKNAIYGSFSGRTFAPDVLLVQEFISATATSAFLTILNTAPGSPGDWAAAPFINGADTDAEFFYRTSKVTFLGVTVVSVGGVSPLQPRNIQRYDFRPVGYSGATATMGAYSSHMKAQESGSDDEARRLLECTKIRQDAQALPAGWNFILGGDFNINTSSEAAYQQLIGSQVNNQGRFWDPIASPGSWGMNATFKYIHTQDPSANGGMNDRFDQLLLSASLVDDAGLAYIGNPLLPFSTTTWNDPNHSYRCWGNDGTSLNQLLTTTGNANVGASIAQSLISVATTSGGHLPVFLDMRVPGKAQVAGVLNFGEVPQNSVAQEDLQIGNVADTALWTANGISNLKYSFSAAGDVTGPAGNFSVGTSSPNIHQITLNTSSPGSKSGTITITTDDPDQPTIQLNYTGTVVEQVIPDSFSVSPGSVVGGDLSSLYASDDNRLVMRPGAVLVASQPPLQLTVLGGTTNLSPSILKVGVESSASVALEQRISMYDYTLPGFVEVDVRTISGTDSSSLITIPANASKYIDQTSGEMKVKVTFKTTGPVLVYPWQGRVDRVYWSLG